MIHFHEGIIGNAGLLELISNFYLDLDLLLSFLFGTGTGRREREPESEREEKRKNEKRRERKKSIIFEPCCTVAMLYNF